MLHEEPSLTVGLVPRSCRLVVTHNYSTTEKVNRRRIKIMHWVIFRRAQLLRLGVAFAICLLLSLSFMTAHRARTRVVPKAVRSQEQEDENVKRDQGDRVLFVWAGDQARTNPDFLAVVNFDEGSADYGKVVTTVPLPGPGATGNEPHHVGL